MTHVKLIVEPHSMYSSVGPSTSVTDSIMKEVARILFICVCLECDRLNIIIKWTSIVPWGMGHECKWENCSLLFMLVAHKFNLLGQKTSTATSEFLVNHKLLHSCVFVYLYISDGWMELIPKRLLYSIKDHEKEQTEHKTQKLMNKY